MDGRKIRLISRSQCNIYAYSCPQPFNVLYAQLTRDLFAIAKFLFKQQRQIPAMAYQVV